MTSLLGDVLAQKVTVTSNGKRKRIRSDTAILLRLREKALAGDLRAAGMLMSLRALHLPDSEGEGDSRNGRQRTAPSCPTGICRRSAIILNLSGRAGDVLP